MGRKKKPQDRKMPPPIGLDDPHRVRRAMRKLLSPKDEESEYETLRKAFAPELVPGRILVPTFMERIRVLDITKVHSFSDETIRAMANALYWYWVMVPLWPLLKKDWGETKEALQELENAARAVLDQLTAMPVSKNPYLFDWRLHYPKPVSNESPPRLEVLKEELEVLIASCREEPGVPALPKLEGPGKASTEEWRVWLIRELKDQIEPYDTSEWGNKDYAGAIQELLSVINLKYAIPTIENWLSGN